MPDFVLVALAALVVVGIVCVIWTSVRYRKYLAQMRSGLGKRPKRVWKPFWFD